MNAYDFTVTAWDGKQAAISDYRGKVLLIVNTATACGFTPQYEELQKLYEDYNQKGLEILDFPCNQFGEQAAGSDEEIHSFCKGRFGITFPQFSKIEVNGGNAAPLYKWLTENTVFGGLDLVHPIGKILNEMLAKADPDFAKTSSIKWNFTKFLIDRSGEIAGRFEPTVSVNSIKDKIEELL